MKRVMGIAGVGALLLFAVNPAVAFADNGPHVKSTSLTTGQCAACHRAHTAKGKDYLLKVDESQLCFSCHGGVGAGATTNVQFGYAKDDKSGVVDPTGKDPAGKFAGALRGGGFDQSWIASGQAYRPMSLLPGSRSLDPAVYGTKEATVGDGANYNAAGTTVTAAGLKVLTKTVPAATAGADTTSAHSVGVPGSTIWGNGAFSGSANAGKAGVELECSSCHDPHGNGNYRILKAVPSDSGVTTGVTIPDSAGARVYTTANYWQVDTKDVSPATQSVTYGGTDRGVQTAFIANISTWCSTCHTRYLADGTARSTDSGDAIFTYRHISDENFQTAVTNASYGTATAPRTPSQQKNCIQCHVAHGSSAAMDATTSGDPALGGAGVNPDGTANATPGKLLRVDGRGTCRMCHGQQGNS